MTNINPKITKGLQFSSKRPPLKNLRAGLTPPHQDGAAHPSDAEHPQDAKQRTDFSNEKSGVNFVIVTGISGAGKSLAIKNLEDIGFFCVDNLPTALIPKFGEICIKSHDKIRRVALGVDIREGEFLGNILSALDKLREMGIEFQILFLDAKDEVIVRRYSETRRRHPLEKEGKSIFEIIQEERIKLIPISEKATKIFDTINLTPHEFKKTVADDFKKLGKIRKMKITIISFGYKYGIPLEADLLIDTRFLPNPAHVKELEKLNGNDKKIADFVLKKSVTQKFLKKGSSFIKFLIPNYINEGKSYLTVAVGCTGGKHRSVVVANELKKFLEKKSYHIEIQYRDINR